MSLFGKCIAHFHGGIAVVQAVAFVVLDVGIYDVVPRIGATVRHLRKGPTSGHCTMRSRVGGNEWCGFDDSNATTIGVDDVLTEDTYIIT